MLANPAFTVSSCSAEPPPDIVLAEKPPGTVFVSTPGTRIFIYSSEGLPLLENHFLVPADGDTSVVVTEGDKIAAGITNCPYGLKLDAVTNYESIELLRIDFADDEPESPVRSGVVQFCGGVDDTVRLVTETLMCELCIRSIVNGSGVLLENPRVRIVNANPFAELFRSGGFRMTEGGMNLPWVGLPADIGLSASYPGILLHCYPNDSPDVGNPATGLSLEFLAGGDTVRLENKLPPLGRGGRMMIDMYVDDSFGLSTEVVVQDVLRGYSE